MDINIADLTLNVGTNHQFSWGILCTTIIGASATLGAAYWGSWLSEKILTKEEDWSNL